MKLFKNFVIIFFVHIGQLQKYLFYRQELNLMRITNHRFGETKFSSFHERAAA